MKLESYSPKKVIWQIFKSFHVYQFIQMITVPTGNINKHIG